MDVTKNRAVLRLNRIADMQKAIKKAKNPDLKKLVFLACATWGISIRTAQEYMKIAQYNIDNE